MSDPRDRNELFGRALASGLAHALAPGGSACPDSAEIAAYVAGGLGESEAERMIEHLADCADCQAQVAVIVRLEEEGPPAPVSTSAVRGETIEPPAAAPVPELEIAPPLPSPPDEAPPEATTAAAAIPLVEEVEEAPDREPDPPERPPPVAESFIAVRVPRGRYRWIAAPLALAATAVLAVFLTHELQPHLAEMTEQGARREIGPFSDVAGAPAAKALAPARDAETRSAPEAAPPPAGSNVSGGLGAQPAEPSAAQNAPAPAPFQAEEKHDFDHAPALRGEAAKPQAIEPPAAVPAAPPPPVEADAAPGTSKDAALARERAAGFAKAEPARIVVPIPTSSRLVWRLTDGTIDLSDDAGATWRTQIVTSGKLTAGAAVDERTCWVVGNAGTVLRTTDGTTWTRIALPEQTDLIGVTAKSASVATVELPNGRRLSTMNGGRSWSKR